MALQSTEIARRIKAEHKQIEAKMADIRNILQSEIPEGEQFAHWRLDLIWLLRDFGNDLLKHFDLEEEGGFMQDVLSTAPRHSQAVENLRTEHDAMAGQINEIVKMLKKCEKRETASLKQVFERISELLKLLAEHEAAESELIVETYYYDVGGGD